jgi:hypothetical protein
VRIVTRARSLSSFVAYFFGSANVKGSDGVSGGFADRDIIDDFRNLVVSRCLSLLQDSRASPDCGLNLPALSHFITLKLVEAGLRFVIAWSKVGFGLVIHLSSDEPWCVRGESQGLSHKSRAAHRNRSLCLSGAITEHHVQTLLSF